jgi:hypothetical protein
MSDNLKACPFCGCEPRSYQRIDGVVRVTCCTDLCGMSKVYMDSDQWNRRTPDAAVLEALAVEVKVIAQGCLESEAVDAVLEIVELIRSKKGTV